ncbi:hypothetical protein HZS_1750 [Henneguya salminicola]|nr:hypothetical protein HZS_1750 [Henneguya salminicola]
MWRKIQEKYLSTLYVNEHLCRKNIKMFLPYAFFPPGNVLSCFEKGQMDQIIEIFKYFEDNLIGRLHRNIRQQPLFAINIWNQFTRIAENISRTNNVVEEWHRGFSALVSVSHLIILKILEILKKEQSLTDLKIENTPT